MKYYVYASGIETIRRGNVFNVLDYGYAWVKLLSLGDMIYPAYVVRTCFVNKDKDFYILSSLLTE